MAKLTIQILECLPLFITSSINIVYIISNYEHLKVKPIQSLILFMNKHDQETHSYHHTIIIIID
jgi:hypothetical protein